MDKSEIICILCPLACRVAVRVDEQGRVVDISNYQCKRGKEYAKTEFRSPVRFLTTTVRVESSPKELLAVKTNRPIPKEKLLDCMYDLARRKVKPPVKAGDVLVKNILETGSDVVVTGDLSLQYPKDLLKIREIFRNSTLAIALPGRLRKIKPTCRVFLGKKIRV